MTLYLKAHPANFIVDQEKLNVLLAMGFPQERSEAALKAIQNKSVDHAVDWLTRNPEPDQQSQSVVSMEVMAPEIDPSALAKLTINKPMSDQDKREIEYHQREADREAMRLRKERQAKKEYEMQVKMRLEEARRAREGRETPAPASRGPDIDILETQRMARKRREEMGQDNQAKRFATENKATPTITATPTTTKTSTTTTAEPQPTVTSASTRGIKFIQIRLPQGTVPETVKAEFGGSEPLREVFHYVASHLTPGFSFDLQQVYPKIQFDRSQSDKTLDELGLQSRVSLAVLATKGKACEVRAGGSATATGSKTKSTFLCERIFTSQTEEEICPICQCPYEDGEVLKQLHCMHEFHSECLTEWQAENSTCPACATSYQ